MNTKKWAIAALGVFIVDQLLDYIIHGVILMGTYEATASLWRPDMESKMYIMWITGAVFAILFVYFYAKGYEGRGIIEGVRYGLWMGLFLAIPMAYNTYATISIPYSLAFQWFIYGVIQIVICGVVAAALYKPEAAAPAV